MGQLYRSIFYRNQITAAVAIGLALVGLALVSLPVQAQSGCTGDPCLFYTPTATPTVTAQATPGPGTPTSVPMPNPSPFPRPNYGIPTSIPNASFPSVPSPLNISIPAPTVDPWMTPEALPMPDVISPSLPAPGAALTGPSMLTASNPLSLSAISLPSQATAIPLATVNSNLVISYTALDPLAGSGAVTGSASYSFVTGLNGQADGIIGDLVSYTHYITGQTEAVQGTDSFTMATAPDWYAPYLPREMANVGWSFEQVESGVASHYSLTTWAWLFGAMIAMPIRLVRGIFELFRFMGPFGLFMIWLLVIMLPAVLGFKILLFIKNSIIRLINFALTVLDWILKIWQAIPWYLGGPG